MADDDAREFVIPVRRRWKLWILPTLAILYFVLVVLLAIFHLEVTGISTDALVFLGLGLFVVTILVEFPFLMRRRSREAEPAPMGEPMAPAGEWQAAPVASAAPVMMAARGDDEKLVTGEMQQGLRVLEYSAPAKSRHKGAVYAKTYVPVNKEHVLRVENLAAEGADL